MNKVIFGAAVLVSGLLFCCPKVEASEGLPKAGFQEFIYGEDEMGMAGFEEKEEPVKEHREMDAYYISEEDKDLLLRIASLEAGNQGVEGMAHVMQTVLNRVFDESFPMTIRDVLLQEGQFTTAKALSNAEIRDGAQDALQLVMNGDFQTNEALYFESMPGKVWEKKHHYLFTYGGHDFYN